MLLRKFPLAAPWTVDLRAGRAWRRGEEVEIEEGSDYSRRMERRRQT